MPWRTCLIKALQILKWDLNRINQCFSVLILFHFVTIVHFLGSQQCSVVLTAISGSVNSSARTYMIIYQHDAWHNAYSNKYLSMFFRSCFDCSIPIIELIYQQSGWTISSDCLTAIFALFCYKKTHFSAYNWTQFHWFIKRNFCYYAFCIMFKYFLYSAWNLKTHRHAWQMFSLFFYLIKQHVPVFFFRWYPIQQTWSKLVDWSRCNWRCSAVGKFDQLKECVLVAAFALSC